MIVNEKNAYLLAISNNYGSFSSVHFSHIVRAFIWFIFKSYKVINCYESNLNNILLGDSGYDSNNIRNKLKNIKFGKLLTYKNRRNTKDKNKLNNIKLSNKEIKILKNKCIKIEHINAKLKNYN